MASDAGAADRESVVEFSRDGSRGLRAAVRDLATGLRHRELWSAFAWEELRHRYRRSFLGLVWIPAAFALLVAIKGLFFASFSGHPLAEFTLYVALGFLVYQFFVGNLNEGCAAFTSEQPWILSGAPVPYSVFVFKSVARNTLFFGGNAVVVLAAFLLLPASVEASAALPVALALGVYVANAVSIQLLFATVGARVRDLQHFVQSVTRMLFFMTPVIWTFDQTEGVKRTIAELNPLTHFIEILRSPVLGTPTHESSWAVVLGLTAIGWLLALAAFALCRSRLPYWLG